jgi:hypothetical protein
MAGGSGSGGGDSNSPDLINSNSIAYPYTNSFLNAVHHLHQQNNLLQTSPNNNNNSENNNEPSSSASSSLSSSNSLLPVNSSTPNLVHSASASVSTYSSSIRFLIIFFLIKPV